MDVDIEVCKKISTKSGLPLQFVLKEYAVFDVLAQIANIAVWDGKIAFKGGTALNKVYLAGVQRFSEDLDFDVKGQNVQDAIGFCNELREKIKGYDISRAYKVGEGAQFYCKYESLLGGEDNVRVDASAKRMITANPLERNIAKSDYCQLSVSGILVYSFDDLVARKLNALRCRGEGKDFFDVYQSIGRCKNLKGAVEKLILDEKLEMKYDEFMHECAGKTKKADFKKMMKIANPYIPAHLRPPDWKQMLNEMEYEINSRI
jgi:predicted nucleotidyltransferase component of viral defense system